MSYNLPSLEISSSRHEGAAMLDSCMYFVAVA